MRVFRDGVVVIRGGEKDAFWIVSQISEKIDRENNRIYKAVIPSIGRIPRGCEVTELS